EIDVGLPLSRGGSLLGRQPEHVPAKLLEEAARATAPHIVILRNKKPRNKLQHERARTVKTRLALVRRNPTVVKPTPLLTCGFLSQGRRRFVAGAAFCRRCSILSQLKSPRIGYLAIVTRVIRLSSATGSRHDEVCHRPASPISSLKWVEVSR